MVASVTRLKAAATTVHYFEVDGYDARNDPDRRKASSWHGDAVALLGLHGRVNPKRFEAVFAGYVPGTDLCLGRLREGEHQHRPGVDVTFSAPKSVSLGRWSARREDRRQGGAGARRGDARHAGLHRDGAASDPELRSRDRPAPAGAGRRHGGGDLPPPGEPQPRPSTAHACGHRQHDARPGRGLAQRRVRQQGSNGRSHPPGAPRRRESRSGLQPGAPCSTPGFAQGFARGTAE